MKKVLIVLGVLVLLLGILLWRVYANLDKIVAGVIEDVGSEVTRTAVRVGGVELDLMNGRAGLAQLSVANPPGFSKPEVFTLERVAVAINMESVGGSPLVIEEIVVQQPGVAYEINAKGISNLDILKQNVESYGAGEPAGGAGEAPGGQEPAAPGEEIRLIIRRLHFDGGRLHASSALRPDKPLDVALPAFTMNNIGQAGGGATSSEIAREVLQRLLRQATDAASKAGVDQLKADLEEKARGKLDTKLKGLLGE